MNVEHLKKSVVLTTVGASFLTTTLWLVLLLVNYFTREPIILHFNHFGERNTEIVVMTAVFILMAYSLYKIHEKWSVE